MKVCRATVFVFVLLVFIVLSIPQVLFADRIHLKNGAILEGRTHDLGDSIRIEFRLGSITVHKKEIVRFEIQKTLHELYEDRLLHTDMSDPSEVERLARWCKKNGLNERWRQLVKLARGLRLERKVREILPGDAERWYKLAIWSRVEGYPDEVYRYLLERTIRADPEYAEARKALGHSRFRGKWLPHEEIARIRQEEFEREMRARGLVKYRGKWITPDARVFEEQREEIEQTRKELTEALERVEEEREKIDKIKEAVDKQAKDLEREKLLLSKERRELERLRAEIRRRQKESSSYPLVIYRHYYPRYRSYYSGGVYRSGRHRSYSPRRVYPSPKTRHYRSRIRISSGH
jgi:hypothetical protein